MSSRDNIHHLLQQGYRYAFSLSHNPARAEDLVQDAWLSILKSHAPHNAPYLFTVIRNHFLNELKREKIIPLLAIDEASTEQALIDSENDFSQILANSDQLEKALVQLRSIERETIYLYYIEEYSTSEIANLTELSKGAVCSLIHRARIKLKDILIKNESRVAL
ncbi:MAG: RNA polymerase sigma factor [Gammaproteobacteria bacterium]|nr:RNA polymerase sigma factor [Gammaproteobacteria bacterium]